MTVPIFESKTVPTATVNSDWISQPAAPLDEHARAAAIAHQQQLTKPAGSLGRLETIATEFAAWQGRVHPQLQRIAIRVFAADHGVCAQGVSAFPQAVTAQMIANFASGGAAISVLAKQLSADLRVVNVGTVNPVAAAGVAHAQIAPGTRDFTCEPAMTDHQLAQAIQVGADAVPPQADMFIGGEMGIGNTTSASALMCVLLDLAPEEAVGPGTGVDAAGLERKQLAVGRALALHRPEIANSPRPAWQTLRCLGGLEIAALVGAYIRCAQQKVPVLVDGFISTAAALCAVRLNPAVADWLLFAHVSAESAHRLALTRMNAEPLLDLQMRLGEGSGAAVAVPLLQAALALHNQMATFSSAGVSERE